MLETTKLIDLDTKLIDIIFPFNGRYNWPWTLISHGCQLYNNRQVFIVHINIKELEKIYIHLLMYIETLALKDGYIIDLIY